MAHFVEDNNKDLHLCDAQNLNRHIYTAGNQTRKHPNYIKHR